MSLAALIDPTILDTILARLSLLFMAASGNPTAARQAAAKMLEGFNPGTEDELSLAADIIAFRMHSLEALSQAAQPDLPLRMVLRLRGGAVSLNREAHRSQRKLDQVQRDRRAAATEQPATEQPATQQPSTAQPATMPEPPTPDQSNPNRPSVEKAVELIELARDAIDAASKGKVPTWTKAYNQRLAAQRLAERARRTAERQLAEAARAGAASPALAQAL